jgi:hypothetical protein
VVDKQLTNGFKKNFCWSKKNTAQCQVIDFEMLLSLLRVYSRNSVCSEWFRIRRLTDPLWQFIEARKEQQQQQE